MGVKVREKVRGSGEWWIFIHHKGKRVSKKVGKDFKKAQHAAEKIKATLTLEKFDIHEQGQKTAPLFKEVAAQWLDIHIKNTKRRSTYTRYRSTLQLYVNPMLGGLEID